MRLGWPGFRPSLLPFWNFFAGLGLAIGFPCFPYFRMCAVGGMAPAIIIERM